MSAPLTLVRRDGPAPGEPPRRHLPDERECIAHRFCVAGFTGYLHVGLYPDTGMPGEIFIHMSKQGSVLSGVMNALSVCVSLLMQYGVPLRRMSEKFVGARFDPQGRTDNPDIAVATSIIDYIFRYLELRWGGDDNQDGALESGGSSGNPPSPA